MPRLTAEDLAVQTARIDHRRHPQPRDSRPPNPAGLDVDFDLGKAGDERIGVAVAG